MLLSEGTGMVSAVIRPPTSLARLDALNWCAGRSGSRLVTPNWFQLIGLFAVTLICAR